MRGFTRYNQDDEMFSPGMDLIISLLAILLIIIVFGIKLNSNISTENIEVKDDLSRISIVLEEKSTEVNRLLEENKQLQGQIRRGKIIRLNSFPPNIIIEGAGKYAFNLGQAELTSDLKKFIGDELTEAIEDNFSKYNINVVEIIGHTDGQPLDGEISNLDKNLEKVVNNNISAKDLKAGSNADLGLMRALAVVTELQRLQRDENRLQGVSGFRAYSAAQLTLRNGDFAKPDDQDDDPLRRRIEIRFTRFQPNAKSFGN